jgi:hypothetical protein
MLGERLKQAIKNAGVSYAKAALEMGVSEGNLYHLFKKESFEVAYLLKASQFLNLPLSYFLEGANVGDMRASTSQTGNFNQAGSGNSQKVKVDKGQPQQDLAAALAACQRELALANALVAAKDETITLLRASFTRPN